MIRTALYRTLRTGAALLAGLVTLMPAVAQGTPAPRAITTAVNNAVRVPLSGSVRGEVASAVDLGPVSASLQAHHVALLLGRSAERQTALDQFLADVQNPGSAEYHHWLTPAEYGSRFGVSPEDVQTIVSWLEAQGLTVQRASTAANTITFSGTVGQVEAAFNTSIHSLTVNGQKHMANVTEPQIPAAFASIVKAVVGLNDFHPRSHVHEAQPGVFNAKTGHIVPDFTLFSGSTPYLYADPADIATIYDTPNAALNPNYKGTTYDGTGITVGVAGDSNVDLAPVSNYRTAFLNETTSTVNLPTIIVDGVDPGTNGDQVESWLDLEVLGGIAPKAKINYYTSEDSDVSAGLFNAIERAINDNTVSILSISFGECEAGAGTSTTQYIAELYQQASAQGISVVVSSGDSGAAGCDSSGATAATHGLGVNALGSSPYNVIVGGTDYVALAKSFATYANATSDGTAPYYLTAKSYIPEEPWNDSTSVNGALAGNKALITSQGTTDIIGGGGGKSIVFPKPSFQTAVTPADGVRDVPDVSFLAGNGLYSAVWVLCEDDSIYGTNCANTGNGNFSSSARFSGAGGTSAGTPAFAGMLALIEQSQGTRLGNPNPIIYKLASTKYSTVFHDVTAGNNSVYCASGSTNCGSNLFTTGYDTTTGYDYASGLGSVDVAQMLSNWSSQLGTVSTTKLTINGAASTVTAVHGTSLNFAVSVNPTTATGTAALVANTTASSSSTSGALSGHATIAVSNGAGTVSYNGLPGGNYTVYANYGGDANTAASQSSAIGVNISQEPGSTYLYVNAYDPTEATISNLNAIPFGSYVFAESSVYGTAEGYTGSQGYATGTVTLYDGSTQIGTAPITSGNFASFPALNTSVHVYAPGTHTVTAKFPGDASYSANTSNVATFTVVKGAATVVVTPASASIVSSANDNITVAVTTKSLGTAPTGTITLTANGKTYTNTNPSTQTNLDGTVEAYAVFNLQGTSLAAGSNTLSASYAGDTNYNGSTGSGIVSVTQSSFALATSPISIAAGATTGNTATVTATSQGSFAGVVNLTCTTTTSPSGATSPVTCSIPGSITLSGTTAATTTLTVNSTSSTTGGTYVVTVTGTDASTGKITASATSTVTVTGTPVIPAIKLSNSAAITVTAGATTGNTSTLTVTPSNGFTGAVSLGCAVTSTPTGATYPITCAVAPTSVTISGTAASTATLTISSTVRTTAALHIPAFREVGGTLLAMGLFFLIPSRRRRQLRGLMALAVLISLGAMTGCGGGGSTTSGGGGGTTTTGTTAGAYVVTVTATASGAATQTTTVNVTVN